MKKTVASTESQTSQERMREEAVVVVLCGQVGIGDGGGRAMNPEEGHPDREKHLLSFPSPLAAGNEAGGAGDTHQWTASAGQGLTYSCW